MRPARVPRGNAYGAGLGKDLSKAVVPTLIDAAAGAAKKGFGNGSKKKNYKAQTTL
jgi:hypothetical protein